MPSHKHPTAMSTSFFQQQLAEQRELLLTAFRRFRLLEQQRDEADTQVQHFAANAWDGSHESSLQARNLLWAQTDEEFLRLASLLGLRHEVQSLEELLNDN